jgi:hypothetical protein
VLLAMAILEWKSPSEATGHPNAAFFFHAVNHQSLQIGLWKMSMAVMTCTVEACTILDHTVALPIRGSFAGLIGAAL